MGRNHLVIGALALAATALSAVTILIDPGYLADTSAPLVAVGLMVAAVAGLGGLLLARAPWGRWVLTSDILIGMVLATGSSTTLGWAALIAGGVGIAALLGPWVKLWIRHHAATDSPGPVPLVLMGAGGGAPLIVGLLATDGAGAMHWVVSLTVMGSSLVYGRGNRTGVWLLRALVPATGIALVAVDPQAGDWVIAALCGALGVLAWTPAARRTTAIITPPLPSPVQRRPNQI